ncbi:MAG: ATP-binding protein [Treponema sp.]|jgi:predicted AAA+ superfamily ATPase|nr:ATP-binding protein [Treponema sp.]
MNLEDFIREWQARPLPEFINREGSIRIKGKLAPAVIGMRRSGKTWRLFQEMRDLAAGGVDPKSILYLNFDDDRLYSQNDVQKGEGLLDEFLETFFRINPGIRRKGAYFFLDEIQGIPGWAAFARRIIDTENIKLYVSGSSAKLLSSEIATEFRGRSFPFELLPFSFREYLRYLKMDENPSPLDRSEYENAFLGYLSAGGFPEAFPQDDPQIRAGLLQNYVDMVVLRDVLERYGLSNVRGVRELTHALLAQNGNLVSMKRLADQLAARGLPMGRAMVSRICTHLEDSFLVFFVPLYAQSLQKIRVNPQKVYAVDPGLSYAVSPSQSMNLGQRFEQAVYLELRRRYPLLRGTGISYYLTGDRQEVDFILGEAQFLVQACVSLKEEKTRRRELGALEKAMEELGFKQGTIVTLHERETVKTSAGIIEAVPAWEWFLARNG